MFSKPYLRVQVYHMTMEELGIRHLSTRIEFSQEDKFRMAHIRLPLQTAIGGRNLLRLQDRGESWIHCLHCQSDTYMVGTTTRSSVEELQNLTMSSHTNRVSFMNTVILWWGGCIPQNADFKGKLSRRCSAHQVNIFSAETVLMLHPGHCFCCLQFQISSSDTGYLSSFRILYPVLLVGWFLMPDVSTTHVDTDFSVKIKRCSWTLV